MLVSGILLGIGRYLHAAVSIYGVAFPTPTP